MNRISNIFLIFIFIQFSSCNTKNINSELKISFSDFEPEFVNHIPDSLDDIYKFQIYRNIKPENDWLTSNDVGRLYVQLDFEQSSSTIEKLNNFYSKNNKFTFKQQNKSLIIPLRFKDSIYSKEHKKKQEYLNYINEIDTTSTESQNPLPNFKYTFEFNNENLNVLGLPQDYVTYIIESNNGKFTDNPKYLMKNSDMYFPSNWLHGISKGVSINRKGNEIIYWVIYW